jgi:choline dehydrogenase-like flavoprotein
MAQPDADVVIVGSGLMGAAVACLIRDSQPKRSIVMVDGAPPMGAVPGQHLHDSPDSRLSTRYSALTASGNQALYTGPDTSVDLGASMAGAEPGMYKLSAFGNDTSAMPAAALSWNAGGMGVHWSAAAPWPWGHEVFDGIPAQQWRDDLDRARTLLRVTPTPYDATPISAAVLGALREVFDATSAPGRHVQQMPMALQPAADGRLRRTGPNDIFSAMSANDDPDFELLAGVQAIEILYRSKRTSGVRVRTAGPGAEYSIKARAVVVCADTMRTPQLLFASGLRPSALGHYLNEHAFLTGRVLVDPDRLGVRIADISAPIPGGRNVGSYWLPHSGPPQPFNGQFTGSLVLDDRGRAASFAVGLALYVPTQVRRACRVAFSPTESDKTGMPRMSISFGYSAKDLQLIGQARRMQQVAAERLGGPGAAVESELLPAGSSLHFTGTVRMGDRDDGTTVCDPDGRVWGFDNLYLAGNGVVPTALACNSTLTGMITAVRAARSLSHASQRARTSSPT